jgi:hypothetical protein
LVEGLIYCVTDRAVPGWSVAILLGAQVMTASRGKVWLDRDGYHAGGSDE